MDNAANHTGKENTVLEDWLWEEHSIFALFLPAQTPEWNPIELVWNCLAQQLKHYDCIGA
jgi:transposase